jgi:hypothetical protein
VTHRVVLYTGEGCSLCDEAAAVLDLIGHPYETATDPAYRERIPVITVDGRIISEGPVNGRALRRALKTR